ncbi:Gfo/Idh/MocA family protein [Lignipirellula cremea]|uniref:Glucose--fructose oxidoreductase n=1 Tax=Lignipirellula cremea TaxID=2528010 RepID=A0A518DKP7_9BACT|nr:Gfo/Idh/MocA family oxidoreductase [Lignipirellula cremea]QDU92412.1 Glucose--fructose oxidoreductase precursor [Lignipirellula cremea]
MKEKRLNRRAALRHGVWSFAALSGGALARRQSKATEPNDRLRVGVIGTGVRGKYLIGNLPESAAVTAVCDCAESRMSATLAPSGPLADVLERFRKTDAGRCATYQDYRRMLDREKLDAVIIATPDHHHALAGLLALDAGLDVYLEKPLTVTVAEGRLLAERVKKTGRVLQVGSQQRTMEINRFACQWIRDGGLGKISKVELPNYPGPLRDPGLPAEPLPPGIDWDLFLGPTPRRAYNRKLWDKDAFKVGDLLWRGWDLYRAYSGHIMTNWGAHSVDMVQLALGRDHTGPVTVAAYEPPSTAAIGRLWSHKTPPPVESDNRRFWPVRMHYADGVELHFVHGPDFIQFHGERGVLKMRRNYFETDPPDLVKERPDPSLTGRWSGSGHVARPHLENWLDCIRTRQIPHAPVEAGHRTITICHLANIARELGRSLTWDPARERFVDDPKADALLDRPRRSGFELPA